MTPLDADESGYATGTVRGRCEDRTDGESPPRQRHPAGVTMVTAQLTVEVVIAGVAGGMIGAAIGGLPALSLAGVVITVGEAATLTGAGTPGEAPGAEVFGVDPAPLEAVGVAGSIGFGPVLGPHVAFAGGVAAAAYLGRRETIDTGFRYHQAKKITKPLGSQPDVLLVGGAFGLFGVLVARVVADAGIPVDPVMLTVVLSGFVHRLVFGYPLVGRVRELRSSVLDMTPADRNERWGEEERETSQGTGGRQVVEPWLPEHSDWVQLAVLGTGVGVASGYIALVTGSVFLAFGITAASLLFLAVGLYDLPVTHHMALPASIAALAFFADAESAVGALFVAGVFGAIGALAGELAQRTLYAHGDTHIDPPAVSIVLTTLLLAVLVAAGVFDAGPVPYPEL